jgi:hypothetical protein
MQNGSIGDIVSGNQQRFGVTIIEANGSFVEWADSSGDHFVAPAREFQGFDFTSYGAPRFAPGVTIQNAVPVTPPPPLGVITGFSSLGFEYEDSSGAAHVAINTGICKIL